MFIVRTHRAAHPVRGDMDIEMLVGMFREFARSLY
jgi:hypothetical protein